MDNEFHYVYLLKYSGSIDKLALQKEEVAGIRLCKADNLKNELISNPERFVPHGNYWLDIINKVNQLVRT